jgi:tetratricopeptide (TPR) repeat protein
LSPPRFSTETDRHRAALIAAVIEKLRADGVASLNGEPGAGVSWVAQRVAEVWRRDEPRSTLAIRDATEETGPGPCLVVHGRDPDFAIAPLDEAASSALLLACIGALDLRTATLDPGDLSVLARACEGLPAAIVRAASRVARLGLPPVLEAIERGELAGVEGPTAARAGFEAAIRDRLARHPAAELDPLAELASFESPFLRRDVEAALGADRLPALDALVSVGLVRASEDDERFYALSRFVARAIRALAPEPAHRGELALGRWGRVLYHDAVWLGARDAVEALGRHQPSFARIARRATNDPLDRAANDALLAWSGSPEASSLAELVRVGADAIAESRGRGSPAELALAVAEAARISGLGEVATSAAAIASSDRTTATRAAIVSARLAFNRGELDRAVTLATGAREQASASGDEAVAAIALVVSSWARRERGELAAARAEARLAARELDARGGAIHAARARLNEALVDLALGRSREAASALARERDAGIDPGAAATLESFLCLALELERDYDGAIVAIDRALSLPAPPFFVAIWHTYRGRVALARGDLDRARDDLARSRKALEALSADHSVATALALEALVLARTGDCDAARTELARARKKLAAAPRARRSIVKLAEAAVGLLEATEPRAGQSARVELASFERGVKRHRPGPAGTEESVHLRTMDAVVGELARFAVARGARHERLVVDGAAHRVSYRGLTIELERRATLERLVHVLAVRSNPAGLTDEELVDRTWSGERLTSRSALNRLRVAMAELRQLGLRGALERNGRRYRVRPDVEIELVSGRAR